MLRTLFAGCLAPVGAHTKINGDQLTLTGVVLSTDGQQRIEAAHTLPLETVRRSGETRRYAAIRKRCRSLAANTVRNDCG